MKYPHHRSVLYYSMYVRQAHIPTHAQSKQSSSVTCVCVLVLVKGFSGSCYISRGFPLGHIKVGSQAAEVTSASVLFTHIHSSLMSLMHCLCPFFSIFFTMIFPFLPLNRPDMAIHQPGHPHLHWMLRDTQGAGSPLLADPVPHTGCTQHLRALGKSLPIFLFLFFLSRALWNILSRISLENETRKGKNRGRF